MSTRGVILFVAGTKHNVHAAVCVASLRQHYDGPVALITELNGPGREACELIAGDCRLGPIQVIADESIKAGAHGQSYFCKTLLPQLSPFDSTIFLDADTLVVGPLDELWADPHSGEFVLTQFADWVSTGKKMRQRIIPWAEVEPERAARMLAKPWPALNTGVMAWSRASAAFCSDWTETCRKRVVFMADELAAQIIFPDHPHRIIDDRFNASVVFPPAGKQVLTRDDVRIWHGHGGKFWKRDGRGRVRPGQVIYLPHYERALQENLGGIRGIAPHRKWFQQIEAETRSRLQSYMCNAISV